MSSFPSSLPINLREFVGERLSVCSNFGAAGNGSGNDAPAINAAIQSVHSAGLGSELLIPAGTYRITEPIRIDSPNIKNILFRGDWMGTKIQLAGGPFSTNGVGVFDLVDAKNIRFERIHFDGGCMTPTGLRFGLTGEGGDFNMDPQHPVLTNTSMFWFHGSCENIEFHDCVFEHTFGYVANVAALTGNHRRIKFVRCKFRNNRPHLFGMPGGQLIYGSWTGGILFQGNGSNRAVSDCYVENCDFERSTGNQVWMHAYGFGKLHSNVNVINCNFIDIGRDGVLMAVCDGGSVHGNHLRRIGYVATADTGAATPRWLNTNNNYAVAIDTSGLTKNINYVNNQLVNVNGGCMDLDGFSDGEVVGNSMKVSLSDEPEYAEDQIGTAFGPSGAGDNWTYGIQPSNTSNNAGASNVHIHGNKMYNLGGGAVRLAGARKCSVERNLIVHPSTANIAPIWLFHINATRRSTDNTVRGNTIHYSPNSIVAAIQEIGASFGYTAFNASDRNIVYGNDIIGNGYAFEFGKDASSGSTTRQVFTTSTASAVQSDSVVQREGTGSGGYLRFYAVNGGTGSAKATLADTGPLFNVSGDGSLGTGVITTGSRGAATFGWYDLMHTSKVVADGMVVVSTATFSTSEANGLSSFYALIRGGDGLLEYSTESSGGARVWRDLRNRWTYNAGDLYYDEGDVGIGTASPAYPLDVAGDIRSTAVVRAASGYEGGSFRGAGVAVGNNGISGAAIGIWHGSGTSNFAVHVGSERVGISAWTVNADSALQQGGVAISSLFAAISHNHDGVYAPMWPAGNPYMTVGDVTAAFADHIAAYHAP